MSFSNVSLTPQLVQAVRDAADILAVAGDHTRLKKAGRRYSGLCPLHKEKSPSFTVDPGQGLFYCFGCGAGGDAIKLHMLLTGEDFPAAIETLATRHGIPLPALGTRRQGVATSGEPDLEAVLTAAAEYFRDQLRRAREPQTYLADRRISSELIDRFGLGYAPDGWRGLVEALHPRLPLGELEAAGLITRSETKGDRPYDRFRHRLMFPIRNAAGRLVGFGGRTLGDDRAKYINTNETDRFQKGQLLYALDLAKRAIREKGKVLLVEGYFDVIGAVACGLEHTVASMGTALTPEQVRLLARYTDEVVVGYDGDDAGENAFRRALPLLVRERLAVYRPRFPDRHDPDSLRLAAGSDAVVRCVEAAKDGVELELERLVPPEVHREPRLRARATEAVAELLRPLGDPVLRWSYGQMAADRLGIPAQMLWKRLGVDRASLVGPSAGRGGREAGEGLGPSAANTPPRLHPRPEDVALGLLLVDGPSAGSGASSLPPDKWFDAEVNRNILRAFAAYLECGGTLPVQARDLTARLAAEPSSQSSIDQLSRLLLERWDGPGKPGELQSYLEVLEARAIERRLREIAREILEAQSAGDMARASSLAQEKQDLRNRSDAARSLKKR